MVRVDRLAVAAALLASAAVAALLPSTEVSGAGIVRATGTPLTGGSRVSAGDWIAAGYELAFVGDHPAATVRLVGGAASVGLSCGPTQPPRRWLTVGLAGAPVTIGAGDVGWRPAAGAADPASYEGSAQVPDVCAGRPIYVNTAAAPSVLYGGTVISSDTVDQFAVRFHSVTAAATNCAAAGGNPSPGQAVCAGVWGPAVRTTAAPVGTPAPSTSPSPTAGPSASASPSPSVSPTATATAQPSATASPQPSPSASPSAPATPGPSSSASPSPTAAATPTPTPTAVATSSPTPTAAATSHPTVTPTRAPARSPAARPPATATPAAAVAGTGSTPVALAQVPVTGTDPSPPPPAISVAPPPAVLPSLTPQRPIVWYIVLGIGDLLLLAWVLRRRRRRPVEAVRG